MPKNRIYPCYILPLARSYQNYLQDRFLGSYFYAIKHILLLPNWHQKEFLMNFYFKLEVKFCFIYVYSLRSSPKIYSIPPAWKNLAGYKFWPFFSLASQLWMLHIPRFVNSMFAQSFVWLNSTWSTWKIGFTLCVSNTKGKHSRQQMLLTQR